MERRAVKIEDNKVINLILIDDDTPAELYDLELEADSPVAIGWGYVAGEFVEPEQPKPVDAGE